MGNGRRGRVCSLVRMRHAFGLCSVQWARQLPTGAGTFMRVDCCCSGLARDYRVCSQRVLAGWDCRHTLHGSRPTGTDFLWFVAHYCYVTPLGCGFEAFIQ